MFSTGINSATLNMAAMAYSIISNKRKREYKDNLILETARAKTFCLMLQWCAAGGNPKQPADEEKKLWLMNKKEIMLPQLENAENFLPQKCKLCL